ncbi:MAG: hypothetical protein LIP00_01170 [Parabacteroides sp.]|nr:hypothetical protein [Parabacteroides sp.]
MKKLALLMLLALVAMACEGPAGPPGEPGIGLDIYSPTYTVLAKDWERFVDPNGNVTYKYVFEDDKIYPSDFEDGIVIGYIFYYPEGEDVQAKTTLPYIEYGVNRLGKYTRHYTFDYSPGYVAFYVQIDNANPEPPSDCTFQMIFASQQ